MLERQAGLAWGRPGRDPDATGEGGQRAQPGEALGVSTASDQPRDNCDPFGNVDAPDQIGDLQSHDFLRQRASGRFS